MKNLPAATITDGYKVGHGAMYADATELVYSNLTPRSDKIYRRNCTEFYDGKLVFVGVQGAVQEIQETWDDEFFFKPISEVVPKFAKRMAGYLGGEVKATEQLRALYLLGYLPIEVKALEEGSKVPMGIPVMTIVNTKPEFFWLTNYLETLISALVWKPSTNATIAAEYRAIVDHYGDLTGTDEFSRSIQCHDFSFRGMSGPEDAARSGFAHLTSFIGTDTLPAMDYAELYYDAPEDSLIAISVPATEHAVATSNILHAEQLLSEGGFPEYLRPIDINVANYRLSAEMIFMKDLITRKFPTGIVSYVADSFDFWAVLTQILPSLREDIMSREAAGIAPGKLVIRPDSGDPVKVVCGYKVFDKTFQSVNDFYNYADFNPSILSELANFEVVNINGKFFTFEQVDPSRVAIGKDVPACEVKGAVQVLWEIFGGTRTEKGYKLLDSHIGLIYGDSITTKRAEEILRRLAMNGFASGNIVFGVGSYTYQCNTRDTFGFAVKATYTVVDGLSVPIFKDPKTDSKKKSAKGLLFVGPFGGNPNELYLIDDCSDHMERSDDNLLKTVFKDGRWVRRTTLDEIRQKVRTLKRP